MNEISPLDAAGVTDRYAHVIRRIAREERIRKRTATRSFLEMLKFLDVAAQADGRVSPPKRVDAAWHCFVLFTREYAEYCESRFGRFIHHEPMESEDRVAYQRAYEDATARFGTLDRRIWPHPGDSWILWFGGGCFTGGGCSGGGGGCGGGG